MGTIIPIVKNKRESTNNSDNFRGICLQSSLCKLLDLIILRKEASKLQTSESLLGFKAEMSTDVSGVIVKETIDYYKVKVVWYTVCQLTTEWIFVNFSDF